MYKFSQKYKCVIIKQHQLLEFIKQPNHEPIMFEKSFEN